MLLQVLGTEDVLPIVWWSFGGTHESVAKGACVLHVTYLFTGSYGCWMLTLDLSRPTILRIIGSDSRQDGWAGPAG